jgi:hypothetical protein
MLMKITSLQAFGEDDVSVDELVLRHLFKWLDMLQVFG